MKYDPVEFLRIVRPALKAGDAAALAETIGEHWNVERLCVFLRDPAPEVRQVAAVGLGMVGDRTCVGTLARALHDEQEQVHAMAEHGLWTIWFRSSEPEAARPFEEGTDLLGTEHYREAVEQFEAAIRIDPDFAEAYNQAGMAHFFLGEWHTSIDCCQEAVACQPCHFGALSQMGHSYAHLHEFHRSLDCYRRTLAINPRMPTIASASQRLARKLECGPTGSTASSTSSHAPPRHD